MHFLWFLLIGIVAGWLAGTLVRGGGFGLLGNMILGVLGSMVGGSVFSFLGFGAGSGTLGRLIVATCGAVLLIVVVRLIKKA
ncbi:Uncharacterized membrane protein YeaQ/YmgE, transglycosylase-associated protein family [Andreprevotia lacus DSM 23236]|uniref:Uncharacterized membrane protein YeaQ/YmgE, transglycosylase-associated protein family n=1 Tax=Andreprevotia lacus DSM 23236 TaxID=1121001 RepID=A0A1W1XW26_9NEIS|nr:GlsB/YeaQ/YmgE family stress response membrane protein [Andreprevotia lacus]SMC28062.1 Uncharacterized membrane protein YeaQ/YmgE, transglycosylase-associated protein family [Andreprevotia lacus DSM 23236]